jgi:hypothetical protein
VTMPWRTARVECCRQGGLSAGKAMGFNNDRIEHVAGNESGKMSIEELYEFMRSEA